MSNTETLAERKVRVDVPLLVSFSNDAVTVREFTVNLSIGGMFIPTDHSIEVNSQGTVKFRISQFEEPHTLNARVIHIVSPECATDEQPAGIGIQLLDLDDADRRYLENLVEGGKACSIVETIRRSARDCNQSLLQILRTRPVGQKVMLAMVANSVEIDALIRDGNSNVIQRLMESPRLNPHQVILILRQRSLPPAVVRLVRRESRWMDHEEVRYLFRSHPRAPLQDVKAELPQLKPPRIQQLVHDMNTNPAVRAAAKQLAAKLGIRLT